MLPIDCLATKIKNEMRNIRYLPNKMGRGQIAGLPQTWDAKNC